ncbi:MAG: class I SAM-dependent methyltransferase [Clostridia bacterium]|nr:class I SAM-dependent methyltransferase [Clostridia bacterium]
MRKYLFLCPQCSAITDLTKCDVCGYQIPQVGGIYKFCEDGNLRLDGENQYIGYDNIGENFEPTSIYYGNDRYGVYEACGDLIAQTLGTNITVLDLGAGLGSASIPLAQKGIFTIAVDISEKMLSVAVNRAKEQFNNLIFARMNAYRLMIPDNSIDIVIENALLHLVDNPEKVIREITRVLKPNGKLIRYTSPAKSLTNIERKQRDDGNRVLSDISERYYAYLNEKGYQNVYFDNRHQEHIELNFDFPYYVNAENFEEVFTDKVKFRLHRLQTGAHSDLQNIPQAVLDMAWQYVHTYAVNKYGENYKETKGFARYGAALEVYPLKNIARNENKVSSIESY